MWEGDVWVAIRAARAGADEVRFGTDTEFATEMKGAVDPVTEIDTRAETAIRSVISTHFPDDSVLGEEGGGAGWDQGRVWIVDPLDGTVNFVHGIPHFAVSVALWIDSHPSIGVVIDVSRNEEFVAVAGRGATLNDEPISTSATADIGASLLITGFPYDRREHARAYLEVVESIIEIAQGVRRLGSAALDLAWVACGRFDGYWEHGGQHGIKPWDIAAGVLLVTEAGGTVTDESGKTDQLDVRAVVATNGLIHETVQRIVADTMPSHLT
jgi:myo-inositol-1(or 4)-monophosphatase